MVSFLAGLLLPQHVVEGGHGEILVGIEALFSVPIELLAQLADRRFLVVADETSSWSRPFVRLTNEEMVDRAGMNERVMRRVRKRLLNEENGKAYLVRRRDPDDKRRYLYGLIPPQWWRDQEIDRGEIRRVATPGNGAKRR